MFDNKLFGHMSVTPYEDCVDYIACYLKSFVRYLNSGTYKCMIYKNGWVAGPFDGDLP